jgi:hypothetical protein
MPDTKYGYYTIRTSKKSDTYSEAEARHNSAAQTVFLTDTQGGKNRHLFAAVQFRGLLPITSRKQCLDETVMKLRRYDRGRLCKPLAQYDVLYLVFNDRVFSRRTRGIDDDAAPGEDEVAAAV